MLSATWAVSTTSEFVAEDAAGTESAIFSLDGVVAEGSEVSVTLNLQNITTDASDYQNPGSSVAQAVSAYAGPGSLNYSTITGVLTYTGGVGGTWMADLLVPIEPIDDTEFEYTESLEVFLTNPSSSTGGTVTVDPGQASQTINILDNDGTALDRYVAKPDATYAYTLNDTIVETGMTTYVIDLTSQTWRTPAEVDRTVWEHEVHLFVPDGTTSDTAILYVGSGDNGDPNQAIRRADAEDVALHTGQITIYLPTVPNQSLTFTDDGVARREDGIMAYTFDKFLDGGDDEWPVLLPMVKSAVRAMDMAREFLADNTAHTANDFFVTGGSKRGWTTYLTAAVDPRVSAITPVVFDYVNSLPTLEFHQHVFDGVTEGTVGGYAETLQSYVEFEVFARIGTPAFDALVDMIDPYSYLDRLTQPKFAVLSTGDQFMPMNSQFYVHDMQGPMYLRYIPNTGHNAGRAEGKGFFAALDAGAALPVYDWTVEGADDNTIRLNTTTTPVEVKLWQATNPDSLDFRVNYFGANWTSTVLTDQGGGEYVGSVPVPVSGGTGFLLEMTYDVGGETLIFTTEGRIVEALTATVDGRHIFYNQSFFDGNTAGFSVSEDAAIDPVRTAYLPGAGAATDANITGYDKGINGIMIDIANAGSPGSITAADFVCKVGNNSSPNTWAAAPAPSAIQVRTGAGVGGSDRVDIIWANNAIEKHWLQVQVLANANTGLPDNFGGGIGDVFFWGNAVGDGDTGNSPTQAPVNATDEIGVRNNPHNFGNPATVDDQYDYNKDRFVNATDQIISRDNSTNFLTQLKKINIGTGGPFAPEGGDSDGDAASVASGGQFATINGDAGIVSALAVKRGSSDEQALPSSVGSRLASADPAAATADDAGLLLEAEDLDVNDDDLDAIGADLDDDLLDALALGIALD